MIDRARFARRKNLESFYRLDRLSEVKGNGPAPKERRR
jgi:hypothetical protein